MSKTHEIFNVLVTAIRVYKFTSRLIIVNSTLTFLIYISILIFFLYIATVII